MKPLYCTILASSGGVLAAVGFGLPAFGFLLPVAAGLFLYGLSAAIGQMAFKDEHPGVQAAFGFLGSLALLAAAGGGTYYAYALNAVSIPGLLIILPWAVFVASAFHRPPAAHPDPDLLLPVRRSEPIDTSGALVLLAAVGSDIAALRLLAGAATAEAIRSPWDVVSPAFFVWIFLATFSLIVLGYRGRFPHLTFLAALFHLFTLLSPALVVYAVGYGFDPFIHIATEELIVKTGSVLPKHPYYLGQYAIVAILARLAPVGVGAIDRLLAPVLAALYLPLGAVLLLRRGYKLARRDAILAAVVAVPLLPLGVFAATTPQGLGDLFAVMTAMLGVAWIHDHRPSLAYLLLLAAAAMSIHPLAGVPALCFVLFLAFGKLKPAKHPAAKAAKAAVFIILLCLTALALPVMFLVNAGEPFARAVSDAAALAGSLGARLTALPAVAPLMETRFAPAIDFAQLVLRLRAALLIALAAAGGWLLSRASSYRRTTFAVAGFFIAALVGVFLLQGGIFFQGVIAYEQQDYARRLFELLLLMLAPLVMAAVAWWMRHLKRADLPVRFFHCLLAAAVITALAYGAFPRHDAFALDRGYSVSSHDIAAVRAVDAKADAPYIVLADQSVSAAALYAFGFKTYYGDQFYYPIPTGGPLYRYYLGMVYEGPTRATMEAAMRSVGVKLSYFIINDYWTDAPKIVAAAKKMPTPLSASTAGN